MNKGQVWLLVLLDLSAVFDTGRSRDPNAQTANGIWPWRRRSRGSFRMLTTDHSEFRLMALSLMSLICLHEVSKGPVLAL